MKTRTALAIVGISSSRLHNFEITSITRNGALRHVASHINLRAVCSYVHHFNAITFEEHLHNRIIDELRTVSALSTAFQDEYSTAFSVRFSTTSSARSSASTVLKKQGSKQGDSQQAGPSTSKLFNFVNNGSYVLQQHSQQGH